MWILRWLQTCLIVSRERFFKGNVLETVAELGGSNRCVSPEVPSLKVASHQFFQLFPFCRRQRFSAVEARSNSMLSSMLTSPVIMCYVPNRGTHSRKTIEVLLSTVFKKLWNMITLRKEQFRSYRQTHRDGNLALVSPLVTSCFRFVGASDS
jgi:hypothetical protein